MTTPTDWRALCAELVDGWVEGRDMVGPIARARTLPSQPEPETVGVSDEAEISEDAKSVIPWLLEMAVQAANKDAPYAAGILTLAAQLLGEAPTRPQPVAVSERFEFSVFDSECEEQAGGTTPTYDEALGYGQHYLAQYQQDGPHTLEVRRVEILPHHALPVPQS